MKLMIDIPETPLYRDMYTAICENGYIFDEDNEYIAKAIANGTPIPDNAKNDKWIPVKNPKIELPKDRMLWVTKYLKDYDCYFVSTTYWDMTEWSKNIDDVIAYMDYEEPEPYQKGGNE